MKRHHLKVTTCAVFLLSVMLLLSSCGSRCTETEDACLAGELSEHYRKNHDYQSLVLLIPFLDLYDMTRADVEQMLGAPSYCPTLDQCYYPTDEMILTSCGEATVPDGETCINPTTGDEMPPLRFPMILVVRYQLMGNTQPESTDPLSWFWFSPVGE
jgi:hypothetical protein